MILLVHGAWHDRWCWESLEYALRELGITSLAIDLPGHGDDRTPTEKLTLDCYTTAVVDVLHDIAEPVLLVGHSLGGVTISQVAERAPERLSGLVYLAAVLVDDGQSIVDATADSVGGIAAHVTFSQDMRSFSLNPAAATTTLYDDCPPALADAAIARLRPEPFVITSTPVHVTGGRWGSLPRFYIVCTQDRAIMPTAQRKMIDQVGVDRVVELESSHSPFLSMPHRLAAVLATIQQIQSHGSDVP